MDDNDHKTDAPVEDEIDDNDNTLNAQLQWKYQREQIHTEVHHLMYNLPRNLHIEKQMSNKALSNIGKTVTEQQNTLGTLEEETMDGDDDIIDQDEPETNHRQHSIVPMPQPVSVSAAVSDVYCHSFDLSNGTLHEQFPDLMMNIHVFSCNGASSQKSQQRGICHFRKIVFELSRVLDTTPNRVIRLVLYRSHPSILCVSLPLLLAYIRNHHLPVVLLVIHQAWSIPSPQAVLDLVCVQRTCDVVLEIEGFASRREYPPPIEFRDLHGILHVRRMNTVTGASGHGNAVSSSFNSGSGHFADVTVTKRPIAYTYGLKRDRRKLNIQQLHIPPEEFAAKGGSVGSGGVRSGAGRASKATAAPAAPSCGTSDGHASTLDF
jgi:hypothetical protein